MTWAQRDAQRIASLRAQSKHGLTDQERDELRELRHREIIEATARRRAYFKRKEG